MKPVLSLVILQTIVAVIAGNVTHADGAARPLSPAPLSGQQTSKEAVLPSAAAEKNAIASIEASPTTTSAQHSSASFTSAETGDESDEPDCLSCHPDTIDHTYVHGPAAVGDCTFCHVPHSNGKKSVLVKKGIELCLFCHTDMQDYLKKPVIHPVLKDGCTSCHDPHGSSARKFLPAEGAALCFTCHPAIASKVTASGLNVHAPIGSKQGCASCHDPHASDGPKLLPKVGKDLCLGCHKNVIGKADTVLHGPINSGRCIACHDPHGSPYEKLLVKQYSTSFYVSYNDSEFPLCFRCHSRALVTAPLTSTATKFRDGDRNLHYLHVNRKDMGKRCKFCHVVHGGPNPKLIATSVRFGSWNLPLKFTKTDTGGSCAPGCHQRFSYTNRQVPNTTRPLRPAEKDQRAQKDN